ncbi:MAG: flagellar M-ring protein FliF [Geobacillus sp.]|uniref:Flagellar M-ring protein n=1 Tax=Parageobacillus thermoglucosidasius TaxID=1426 RepID=A0AB38R037_PARTM|nr:flagellar basal-body MS-ring/collar protein FliF [Parageobacillus thermoglucosidasius]REK55039.1 MAG: flagellar M-ring protein FliF [Geobacillus sp.]UOE77411.1 flagellar M-ring protein FliF [Parageobacillus thermoglucosidasius]GCD83353.1 flagellar M-ring protein [Parageobacillus thermoglucosidasius]
MNDRLKKWLNRFTLFWKERTKKQKWIAVASLALLLLIIGATVFFATRTEMVPLYSNLTPQEAGQIKETLDQRNIKSEVADNGTTIKVPKDLADSLKVELAAEGIPNSGMIDYSFFGKNASFGMTDNEFNVVKLEAMQNELANLIKSINGVEDAKVMINLPQPSVFASDNQGEASASIVLKTKPGYQFSDQQIKALYHLVSKSVPNLPTDNIVIMNQFFEYFDLKNDEKNSTGTTFAAQQEIKQQIERDIQQRVQRMLGTMMGQDKVAVSVTADIDFTQERREENLVAPVDEENNEGIAISVQRIQETYSGNGAPPGGTAGTGANEVPNYQAGANEANGNYERTEETINNEVNRIKKDIVESPYKIRDLGIQVMVEPPDPKDPNSLPQQTIDDIQKILGTIVRTSIDKQYGQTLTDQDIQNRVVVSVQKFNGKATFEEPKPAIPMWVYIVGGIGLVLLITLFILWWRSRKSDEEEEEEEEEIFEQPMVQEIPDIHEQETESTMRRKQLERLAKEKPDEFAKLLRTWLSEE